MKLNTILEEGAWKDISNYLNYNFNKISIAASRLEEVGTSEFSTYKGLYQNISSLPSENNSVGDYAFVLEVVSGDNVKFRLFYFTEDDGWLMSNSLYEPDVILGDYIGTSVINNVIEDLKDDISDYLG